MALEALCVGTHSGKLLVRDNDVWQHVHSVVPPGDFGVAHIVAYQGDPNVLVITGLVAIYYTLDAGAHWIESSFPNDWQYEGALTYDQDTGLLYAATAGQVPVGGVISSIVRSSDNGATWDTILPDPSATPVILHHPQIDSGFIYFMATASEEPSQAAAFWRCGLDGSSPEQLSYTGDLNAGVPGGFALSGLQGTGVIYVPNAFGRDAIENAPDYYYSIDTATGVVTQLDRPNIGPRPNYNSGSGASGQYNMWAMPQSSTRILLHANYEAINIDGQLTDHAGQLWYSPDASATWTQTVQNTNLSVIKETYLKNPIVNWFDRDKVAAVGNYNPMGVLTTGNHYFESEDGGLTWEEKTIPILATDEEIFCIGWTPPLVSSFRRMFPIITLIGAT